jgi:arylsulfatase A-like enzyme
VPERFYEKPWPWLVAAGVVALVLASRLVEIRVGNDWESRPRGTAAEIERLRDRDDVNVLFILVDTLRAERLGSYGYPRDTSPTLDRLARSGVRFARQLSQSSWTKSSMASIWTGLYPARTGITRFDDVIPGDARMAAEILKEAGFHTVGLYRNGWCAPTFAFDQGFDVYQHPVSRPPPPAVRLANPTISYWGTDHGVIETAVEFLRVEGKRRWFLYLHLMDLHEYVYDEASALFGSGYSDIYDSSIRWTDGTIESLLASLSELGHLDDTIIAIASDHGEAFLERGFEGHAREVYRETTEVPFILSLPFRLEPGIVVEARTRNVDVWPTLLDLVGLEPPEGIDGRSRVPEILASARGEVLERNGDVAISDLDRTWGQRDAAPSRTVAVVEGPWRYVRMDRPEGARERLFDSREDPLEKRDRASEDPATLERLGAVADAYVAKEPTWGEAPTRELDELELNLLRALGYALPPAREARQGPPAQKLTTKVPPKVRGSPTK